MPHTSKHFKCAHFACRINSAWQSVCVRHVQQKKEGKGREEKRMEGKQREGRAKGREGKQREGKGKGREGKRASPRKIREPN